METKTQELLDKISRMEQAAERGIEMAHAHDSLIHPDKIISVQQCEWTLKDCAMFRKWVNEFLGS